MEQIDYCEKSKLSLLSGYAGIQNKDYDQKYTDDGQAKWVDIDIPFLHNFFICHKNDPHTGDYYEHTYDVINYFTCVLFADGNHIPLPIIFSAIWPRWKLSACGQFPPDEICTDIFDMQVRSIRVRIWDMLRTDPTFYRDLQLIADLYVFDESDDNSIVGIQYEHRVPSYLCREINLHNAMKSGFRDIIQYEEIEDDSNMDQYSEIIFSDTCRGIKKIYLRDKKIPEIFKYYYYTFIRFNNGMAFQIRMLLCAYDTESMNKIRFDDKDKICRNKIDRYDWFPVMESMVRQMIKPNHKIINKMISLYADH